MTTFIFGEAMLEYHSHGSTGLRYGGDTLNTAIHLARAGHDVAYVTAVGTDPISDALVAAWQAEGVDTRFVLRHPERTPGIYAIHLDDQGERSFLYWRERSAAREMFSLPAMADALKEASASDLVYFSLISLAILDDDGRKALLDCAAGRKANGQAVAYDSNYRPLLWANASEAREVSRAAIGVATLGLPTNVDEQQIFGTPLTGQDIAAAWQALGCDRVAVKLGDKGCLLAEPDGTLVELPSEQVKVIDSSGAGDAFNAGFLSAFLAGKPATECVGQGQQLARDTLQHFGAISIDAK